MYESFYNLKEKPFNLLPDPDYLFMSQGHDNAYTHLEYAIAENKGFVIITGEIGSGKTTLINFFLRKIKQDIQVGLINNTYATLDQFTKMICQEFELGIEGMDHVEMLDLFHDFLLKQFAEKKRVVLIVDEAQNLTPEVMEEIRMISNLEAEKHHLIQMIMVGQPELKHKLQLKELEQFAQRVTVSCHLGGLTVGETDQYIRYRLKVGGAAYPNIFDKDAIKSVYEYSHGIPRLINILCDTALVYGYADGLKVIGKKVIEDVTKARDIGGIFADTTPHEKGAPSLPPMEFSIPEQSESRFRLLDRKIALLESMVDNMEQKLNSLVNKKDERDTIIIELFKMLKNSMESRAHTLFQVSCFKKNMERLKEKPLRTKQNNNSPFFRLKRRKGGSDS